MVVFKYSSVKPKVHDFLPARICLKKATPWSRKLGWGVCGASEALEVPQLENQGPFQQMPTRKSPMKPAVRSSSWEDRDADRDGPRRSGDLGISGL